MAKLPDNFGRDFATIRGGGTVRSIDSIPRLYAPPFASSRTDRTLALSAQGSGIYHNHQGREYTVVVFLGDVFPVSLGGFTESEVKESQDVIEYFVSTMCEAWVLYGHSGIKLEEIEP